MQEAYLWFLNPAFTAAPIRLAAGLGPRGELRMPFFDLLIPRQHALEAGVEGRGDLRSAFQRRHQQARRLDGRQPVAARFPAQMSIARGPARPEDHALAFQHPGIPPPQRLGLAPGAVEQDHAIDRFEDRALVLGDLALPREGQHLAVGVEIGRLGRPEIKNRPARGVCDGAAQRLGETRLGQPDPDHRGVEMLRGEPCCAERTVLLLRMLQDQQSQAALQRRDAVADAQRQRLLAVRAIGWRFRERRMIVGLV